MSKFDWKMFRPIVLNQIRNGAKSYIIESMVPVALNVLEERSVLIQGVNKLLKFVPVKTCRHCSEIHIGHIGHSIRDCKVHTEERRMHDWVNGGVNDIIIPVDCFHLNNRFQNAIEHEERLDFVRIPAIVELCIQAGAESTEYLTNKPEGYLNSHDSLSETKFHQRNRLVKSPYDNPIQPSPIIEDAQALAQRTLKAWETLRAGTKELIRAYPARVCSFCSEVQVGTYGHRVISCTKTPEIRRSSKGLHKWKNAVLDHLIPPKTVWCERTQDVTPLQDEGREYYGHAPAIVELCARNGAIIPSFYHKYMKINGLPAPSN